MRTDCREDYRVNAQRQREKSCRVQLEAPKAPSRAVKGVDPRATINGVRSPFACVTQRIFDAVYKVEPAEAVFATKVQEVGERQPRPNISGWHALGVMLA